MFNLLLQDAIQSTDGPTIQNVLVQVNSEPSAIVTNLVTGLTYEFKVYVQPILQPLVHLILAD